MVPATPFLVAVLLGFKVLMVVGVSAIYVHKKWRA